MLTHRHSTSDAILSFLVIFAPAGFDTIGLDPGIGAFVAARVWFLFSLFVFHFFWSLFYPWVRTRALNQDHFFRCATTHSIWQQYAKHTNFRQSMPPRGLLDLAAFSTKQTGLWIRKSMFRFCDTGTNIIFEISVAR